MQYNFCITGKDYSILYKFYYNIFRNLIFKGLFSSPSKNIKNWKIVIESLVSKTVLKIYWKWFLGYFFSLARVAKVVKMVEIARAKIVGID